MAGEADEATDEVLMGQVRSRDQAAFAILVDRYMAAAAAFSQRVVGSSSDAEDVAQEALVKIWTGAATWDDSRGRFRPWFYRILYHAAIDHLRRRVPHGDDGLLEVIDPSDGPEKTAVKAATGRRVKAAVNSLPERQRAAVAFCYYHGLSNREAAEAMDIGVKALEALLVRARRALAETLLEEAREGRAME